MTRRWVPQTRYTLRRNTASNERFDISCSDLFQEIILSNSSAVLRDLFALNGALKLSRNFCGTPHQKRRKFTHKILYINYYSPKRKI